MKAWTEEKGGMRKNSPLRLTLFKPGHGSSPVFRQNWNISSSVLNLWAWVLNRLSDWILDHTLSCVLGLWDRWWTYTPGSCVSSLPLQILGPLSLCNCVSPFLLINLSLFIHPISTDSVENLGLLSADLLSLYYINLYWLNSPITHPSEKFQSLKLLWKAKKKGLRQSLFAPVPSLLLFWKHLQIYPYIKFGVPELCFLLVLYNSFLFL